ncbi:MAG: AmmeMemoRadiSam system radical SAM enzyme [bacterium]|nr:MAG: AmmeMemoRadiSam system radical SAM enzyme [bacterium]
MNDVSHPRGVEALYWESKPGGKIRCLLCPFKCVVKEGKKGICRVKANVGGKLFAVAYGRSASFNFDPIEKKPLYHFFPGTSILSVGLNACNLDCAFCQNFEVSQREAPSRYISPEELARAANRDGCAGIAYTYTEPLMWYEYIVDSARLAKEKGLKTVLVTNGHLEPEPFDEILPLMDALNMDLKSMDEAFYKKICKGRLSPVLRNIEAAAERSHLEVTNLVIPTLNDSDSHFERLASFLADINPMIPLHLSGYHPAYKMNIEPTPPETLVRGAEIAKKWLKYVYIGNVYTAEWTNSYCPHCGNTLVEREGYRAVPAGVKNGVCTNCGGEVNIIN